MSFSFRTPIHLMNEHQREWFATAIISIVVADGNVTREEAESIMRSIAFVKNEKLVETLKKYIQYRTVPTMTAFVGWEKEIKKRACMMLDLMEIAISDRELSPKEKEHFFFIGKLLGFPAPKVEELIAYGSKSLEDMPHEEEPHEEERVQVEEDESGLELPPLE
ncbi:MAG: hypothetical protein OEZ59_04975 [Deltaproteobacteria bacterium]|nr:hypothetical protein [Deltaproteobacteria bacterium]